MLFLAFWIGENLALFSHCVSLFINFFPAIAIFSHSAWLEQLPQLGQWSFGVFVWYQHFLLTQDET